MLIRFLGAVGTVTGSCIYIECNQKRLLIDCGMHQGHQSDEINRASFEFRPSEIDYLHLTHAHIDHSGLIPRSIMIFFNYASPTRRQDKRDVGYFSQLMRV